MEKTGNNNRHYFKAFTLIELVVAMLISSIVVLTAYETYTITTVQCSDYRKRSTLIGQSYQLNMVLNKDCFDASAIWLNSDSSLIFQSDGSPDITYIFRSNYILRQLTPAVQDTFPFTANGIQVKMEPNNLQNGISLIDNFSFKIKVFGEYVSIGLKKEYPADILMMETADAINKN
jgi:prepilin-type N-terminal cleavage/methylation domain-containing protein